jgi:hypothetical protein
MCVLGGVVGLCLGPDTPWKAFYGGITTPLLISTIAKRALAPKRTTIKNLPAGAVLQPASPKAYFEAL